MSGVLQLKDQHQVTPFLTGVAIVMHEEGYDLYYNNAHKLNVHCSRGCYFITQGMCPDKDDELRMSETSYGEALTESTQEDVYAAVNIAWGRRNKKPRSAPRKTKATRANAKPTKARRRR